MAETVLEVRGLRVLGIHGALSEERTRPQPFEVEFEATVDASAARDTDDLTDTVDYGLLAERASEVVTSTSFHLLEALVKAIGTRLLDSDPRVRSVTVTVRKLRPPLGLDVSSVGVRTVLFRHAEQVGKAELGSDVQGTPGT